MLVLLCYKLRVQIKCTSYDRTSKVNNQEQPNREALRRVLLYTIHMLNSFVTKSGWVLPFHFHSSQPAIGFFFKKQERFNDKIQSREDTLSEIIKCDYVKCTIISPVRLRASVSTHFHFPFPNFQCVLSPELNELLCFPKNRLWVFGVRLKLLFLSSALGFFREERGKPNVLSFSFT